jgi:hypothetical protein
MEPLATGRLAADRMQSLQGSFLLHVLGVFAQ